MCLYPRIIKNRKYTETKKNGGKIPPVFDKRVLYVPVACGKCIECMKAKAREWSIRMNEEIRTRKNGQFVTLTFSEESIIELGDALRQEREEQEREKARQMGVKLKDEYNECLFSGESVTNNKEQLLKEYNNLNEIATLAVRRFLERWRKKYKKSVRHWLVTELGHNGTERIHLHGVIFTDEKEDIEKIWKYGWVWLGKFVNEKTINYIVKYIHKIDSDHKEYKPKVLCSAGIGSDYINRIDSKNNKYKGKDTDEAYRFRNGTKSNMPIYYRNKIYSEEEREKLWIDKLNEETRYLKGEKIKVRTYNDLETYAKTLKYYQKENKRLGYGELENWNVKEYKKNRENL